MRRASTCLALLGLAVLGLPASRRRRRPSRSSPKPYRSPGSQAPATSSARAPRSKRNSRSKAPKRRRRALADHARQLLPARRHEDQPDRLRDLPDGTLENIGPSGCPKKSQASPIGTAGVVDPFGGERVTENATLQAFFAPGGGLQFYANAASPISAQLLVAKGSFINAAPPYGLELSTNVPLVQTVPGAPPVSTESINIKVGAAIQEGQEDDLLRHGAEEVPEGRVPVKSEMTFGAGEIIVPATVEHYKAPCPKK